MKIYTLSLITMMLSVPAVFAMAPPDAAVIHVHDMQMINQQRFRYEELNDYKEVSEEKARYQKKTTTEEPLINKLFKKKEFIEEDGQIKIKNTEKY